jgi:DNA-binding NarL/FixJ family response regulator
VLPRQSTASHIVAAIDAVLAGLVVLQPGDLDGLLVNPRPARMVEPLTPREIEVLGMLAEGQSNKAIAHHLGISEHTVKFHVTSIMTKLNAGSRTEAVTLGIRQGLIMI